MKSNGVLSAGLETTLLHEVFEKELILANDQVVHLGSPEVRELRCFLLKNNYLSKESLRHLIHKQLLACGKKMYRIHADSMQDGRVIIFPEHLPSPHALGYAIKYGSLLPAFVRFDKAEGESAKDYMLMAEGLLNNVIAQLLTPYVPSVQKESATNEHACCGCD